MISCHISNRHILFPRHGDAFCAVCAPRTSRTSVSQTWLFQSKQRSAALAKLKSIPFDVDNNANQWANSLDGGPLNGNSNDDIEQDDWEEMLKQRQAPESWPAFEPTKDTDWNAVANGTAVGGVFREQSCNRKSLTATSNMYS
jgi:hypothetical protein